MKKCILLVLLMLAPMAWATTGSCVVTDVTSTQNVNNMTPDPETVIVTLVCTGGSDGSISNTTVPVTGYYPYSYLNAYNLTGYILYQVGRKPGTTAPTASYTVVITDSRGFAVDLGLLTTNGSASAAQLTTMVSSPMSYPVVRGALTVAVLANSVASAGITLDLIFRTRP